MMEETRASREVKRDARQAEQTLEWRMVAEELKAVSLRRRSLSSSLIPVYSNHSILMMLFRNRAGLINFPYPLCVSQFAQAYHVQQISLSYLAITTQGNRQTQRLRSSK